ncbi:MAG: 50S ribosomal protein L25/general stress protein Ctc [Candidatus Polarisedimenticolaceae bacterium]|nr:50S ribosomal protein L25/general stress protein Ctc [Candidatus Polarisedimenticolaceae bacterium]
MSNSFEFKAELRDDTGKGASRRLRRAGLVPGIIYGAHKDPVMITLLHNELIHNLEQEAFYSHILDIELGGKKEKVILKGLQRHPSRPFILHVDFLRTDEKETIRVNVPLHFMNEDIAPGVKAGGRISHTLTEVEVSCLPKNLPEFIEIDLAAVEVGQAIHLSEVNLPEGVEIPALAQTPSRDLAVVSIHAPRAGSDEDAETEGDEETES